MYETQRAEATQHLTQILFMTYMEKYRKRLERRHYINSARDPRQKGEHWYDINVQKYEKYRSEYGDGFCIVLICSDTPSHDDAYVLPVKDIKGLFRPEYVKREDDQRWMGHVKNEEIAVEVEGRPVATIPIRKYYNAFGLLQDAPPYDPEPTEYV